MENGVNFKILEIEVGGEYTAEDATFNYADVPHHRHVHNIMSDKCLHVTEYGCSEIRVQSIGNLFKLPIICLGYKYDKNSFCTYFNYSGVHVIKEVLINESPPPIFTSVLSRYHVGLPVFLLWLRPLINAMLKKNHKILTKDDNAIRQRRGNLRKAGFNFISLRDSQSFGVDYLSTMDVSVNNVVFPLNSAIGHEEREWNVKTDKINHDFLLFGDDHLGFQLIREGGEILLFPRICPHEGACTDGVKISKSSQAQSCPWHGRKIPPSIRYSVKSDEIIYAKNINRAFQLEVRGDSLNIRLIG